MGVNISKTDAQLDLGVVIVRVGCGKGWVSADLDLAALLLDRSGRISDPAFVIYHNNPTSRDGAVAWSGRTGTGEDQQSLSLDLTRVEAQILEVIICVAIDDPTRRLNFGQVEGSCLIASDVAGGRELRRCELGEDFATYTTLEALRLLRVGRTWRIEPLEAGHRAGLETVFQHYAPAIPLRLSKAREEDAPSATRSRPADCDPREIFSEIIGAKAFDGYCSADERQALLREAKVVGLDEAGAEIVLDFELERLRIANEAALLHRLDSILHQFTDDDKKLDDKERRDSLQLACRASGGCRKGLRYDVAEEYVTRFCRANAVKVKAGLFKWAIP
jgi:tellurium resistance protein TerD